MECLFDRDKVDLTHTVLQEALAYLPKAELGSRLHIEAHHRHIIQQRRVEGGCTFNQ